MFGFQEPIALHFGIFAEVMFLARADEEKGDSAGEKTGPEQNGTHSHATVVVKVSGLQLKLRVSLPVLN
ncbi:MAG: hypothetical protein QOH24_518 [Verrucomicrobiota bacterium]|jgi:hypothetical protein